MWRSILWINLIDDESSTNYKLKKKRKEKKKRMKNVKRYLRLKMQKTRNALNMLFKMLCLSQSKQLSLRNSFITSRKFYHFSMRCENLDDASFRWREFSIASINVASFSDLKTNERFVTTIIELVDDVNVLTYNTSTEKNCKTFEKLHEIFTT